MEPSSPTGDFLTWSCTVSLWELLGQSHDMVSVVCWDFPESETLQAADRLLLTSSPDLPDGRTSLFVCAECGDLGCGAITASINRVADAILWCDFGYQNNYEAQVLRGDYAGVGPFEFEFLRYEHAVLKSIEILKSQRLTS